MLTLNSLLSMRSPLRLASIAAIAALISPSTAQTYSTCNPTQQSGCTPNPALGKSLTINFADGESDQFTASSNPTYGPDGAVFTVAGSGQAPTLTSKWYIMFGKYSVTMKAAPGTGIVSSAVLQSDDLDEIDWEWLGGRNDEVQTNYFGKGQTTSYDRAAVHAITNTQNEWHTYTVEWTKDQIVWSINDKTVRVLNAGDAQGQYPQTPMQLKLGSWAGGDPSNSEGTISWAGGAVNYAAGPFSMYVSSVSIVDYSTGTAYSYGDQSGTWESIESTGGEVNGNSGGSVTVADAPAITSTTSGNEGWSGTHATNTATVSYTTLPGLPSGWTISGSGKVVPPSAAPVSKKKSYCPFTCCHANRVSSRRTHPLCRRHRSLCLQWELRPRPQVVAPRQNTTSRAFSSPFTFLQAHRQAGTTKALPLPGSLTLGLLQLLMLMLSLMSSRSSQGRGLDWLLLLRMTEAIL